ncbi:MAG: TonB-dependent receptor, partial [Sphingobacteriales bacterium]
MKNNLLLLIFLFTCQQLSAQQKYTVSGFIKDAYSGETMIGATLTVKGERKGVSSNQYGFYSITLDSGRYNFTITNVGYLPQNIEINLAADSTLNISMISGAALQQEVIVTARKRDNNVKTAQMGKISLPIEQIKQIPAFLGEVDLLKVVQLLPGIRNAGEGSAGIYVRGGGPDQNLIMLDDAVVYNTGHLFGFFSIFNSDAIKNVSLIKGGMPAQYGGRLSSVLDITMKEGNNREFQTEGGIGLI